MALHANKTDLIAEALSEYVSVARMCIDTNKGNGGCFGYPAATMLFICIDAIGSYHRGKKDHTVTINGNDYQINGAGKKHYLILADKNFFECNLSLNQINKLYDRYRCLLVHNAALKSGNFLNIGNSNDPPFVFENDDHIQGVNLKPLLSIVAKAVDTFLSNGSELINSSKQAKGI